jgi:hypothetical protein
LWINDLPYTSGGRLFVFDTGDVHNWSVGRKRAFSRPEPGFLSPGTVRSSGGQLLRSRSHGAHGEDLKAVQRAEDGWVGGHETVHFSLAVHLEDSHSVSASGIEYGSEDDDLSLVHESFPVSDMLLHDASFSVGHVHGKSWPGRDELDKEVFFHVFKDNAQFGLGKGAIRKSLDAGVFFRGAEFFFARYGVYA